MSFYESIWTGTASRVATDAAEVELIAAAGQGDQTATLRLVKAYIKTLCDVVSHYSRVLDRDDARQAALLGFMEAVRTFDPAHSSRLASILRPRLHEALTEAASAASTGFSVPTRTLKRWYGILAAAGGDPYEAARTAPKFHMTEDTFWSVWVATGAPSSLEAEMENGADEGTGAMLSHVGGRDGNPAVSDADDRILTHLAFRAVTPKESAVCALAYGFAEYDPQPDAEIGHRLGMGRVTTLRTRQRALTKMRAALGVDA